MATAQQAAGLIDRLRALAPRGADYAVEFVDAVLIAARQLGASDVHLHPAAAGLRVSFRLDGVLCPLGTFSPGEQSDVVTRLKVLADLLTYRNDTPQEGRLRRRDDGDGVEIRVSTFPTLHGERAVVRLFAQHSQLQRLESLGLPDDVGTQLASALASTSGALFITGPAGSGKTTTAYACLREIVRASAGGRSVVSLEDPVEVDLPGVAQSQTNPAAGFDFAAGLRSLMRQDPEVIMVGEVRDRETVETAFQAALTGQLVITTFHAASAAGAISRLADMGIEAYMLRSGVVAIVCQRLLRKLCACARPVEDSAELLGLAVERAWTSAGCNSCHGTGYQGRMLAAEILAPHGADLRQAILARDDVAALHTAAIASGMVPCERRGLDAIESGQTSPQEFRRVFGITLR